MRTIIHIFNRIKAKILNFYLGFLCLTKALKRISDDESYVFLTDSIGDDIYALSLLQTFKKEQSKRIILFCEKKKEKLVKVYSDIYDEIKIVDKNERLWKLICSYHRNKIAIKIGIKNRIYSTMPYHLFPIRGNYHHDNLYLIGRGMLGIKGALNLNFPNIDQQYEDQALVDTMSQKTIVLNYGSKSMNCVSLPLFERIANDLVGRGYHVYTNIIKGQEPIKNTDPLDCNIFDFYRVCNNACAVVSVRSGILDLIAGIRTPLLVFYFPLETVYGKSSKSEKFYNRFTMEAWHRDNLMEGKHQNDNDSYDLYIKWANNYLK